MLSVLPADSVNFPDPHLALDEPNGLLAVGGDLSVERLKEAYSRGIFPWFSDEDPLLWWSPDPRGVIFPDNLHISRSLAKFARRCGYTYSFNSAFEQVISACAEQRAELEGTWITDDMLEGYCDMHDAGYAHSVEVWHNDNLVGGLYGVLSGRIFSGESMFHRADNASKLALIALSNHLTPAGLQLIDCQMPTPHLESLGAVAIPRHQFLSLLELHVHHTLCRDILVPQTISGFSA